MRCSNHRCHNNIWLTVRASAFSVFVFFAAFCKFALSLKPGIRVSSVYCTSWKRLSWNPLDLWWISNFHRGLKFCFKSSGACPSVETRFLNGELVCKVFWKAQLVANKRASVLLEIRKAPVMGLNILRFRGHEQAFVDMSNGNMQSVMHSVMKLRSEYGYGIAFFRWWRMHAVCSSFC